MGIDVVAEGCETEKQLIFLQENSCGLVQGFYFSPPMTPEVFVRYRKPAEV